MSSKKTNKEGLRAAQLRRIRALFERRLATDGAARLRRDITSASCRMRPSQLGRWGMDTFG